MMYEELVAADIAPMLMADLGAGRAKGEGEKIVYNFMQFHPDTTWIHHGRPVDRDCSRWHKIYFAKFGILPRECLGCWKIVARPKNLKQLFELSELQEGMKLEGKVGVDFRDYSCYKGLYLGFWYCPIDDLEGARKLCREVKRKVRGALSLDVPVILKRGCTEFEDKFGPSNNWVQSPLHRLKEDLLNSVIVVNDLMEGTQPGWIQTHVKRFWIEYAHRMGKDSTVKDFVRYYPYSLGSVPTVTYDDLVPKIKGGVFEDEAKIQGLPED